MKVPKTIVSVIYTLVLLSLVNRKIIKMKTMYYQVMHVYTNISVISTYSRNDF